jgi:hypothetical protein
VVDNSVIVLDDLITEEYYNRLELLPKHLRFFYTEKTVYAGNEYEIYHDDNILDSGQFTAPLYAINEHKDPCYDLITPLIFVIKQRVPQIKFNHEVRVKYNLITRNVDSTPSNYNTPHHDAQSNAYSIVYYCNDSDGDTFLFNEFYEGKKNPEKLTIAKRIAPKKNRCVIFESNRMHASSSPVYSKDRRVINFVIDAHASN